MPTFTQTTTYNAPALAYTKVTGITYPGGSTADPQVIPLHLDQYSGLNAKSNLVQLSVMPIVSENFTYGGVVIAEGANELARVTLGGFIDTPTVSSSGFQLCDLKYSADNSRMTWADFIVTCLEGRVSQTWQRFDPLWFRDPYGRQFTRVRMLDFTASYVEGVPGRTTFTTTLLTP